MWNGLSFRVTLTPCYSNVLDADNLYNKVKIEVYLFIQIIKSNSSAYYRHMYKLYW